jgi:PAS domain S-box-containing protein
MEVAMLGFLGHLFDTANLAPHGICLLWRPELVWLHVVSDSLTALAYFSIPVALAVFVSRRSDVQFGWVFWAFAIFIMACGTTHAFGVWTLWFPDYAAEGTAKAITAVASVVTAVGVWPLLPKALALPSPQQLQHVNDALIDQIRERDAAVLALDRERQRRIESETRLAEEKFRLAVEACPNGMVMVDAAGRIVMANAAIERMFGYPRQELIGQSIDILVPRRAASAHPQLRSDFIADPSSRAMGVGRDLSGLRKDGSEMAVEVGLTPIETRDGLMVLGVIVDISERKAAEQALARQARDLQRSNAELEEFAYVAAHDLQEPLRMVASYTELLGERYAGRLDEKADKYIHYAVDGARRMQRLVNDLLAYSRVGTQGRAPQPTQSDIVLGDVLERMSGRIHEAKADVTCGVLPTVLVDETQLGQLFQNLIGNALKFRSAIPPCIKVDAVHGDREWVFSVEDNGIGIDRQYADRIFQMFQRLHERGKYEGSGIGLAIAKKIVERHGGRIWFESQLGRGTTFYFSLPDARGSDP